MICNKNGENLTDKYIGHKEWEVTPALVDAMVKEVAGWKWSADSRSGASG